MGELTKLYKTSLSLIKAIDNQAKVFDYDDGADFDGLWHEAEGGCPSVLSELKETQNRFVIVWDGEMGQSSPEGSEILLTKHLTPLDWALAFSIKLLRDFPDSNLVKNGLGIHIIDLTRDSYTTSWAMRMRHQLLAEMPWVTMYAPLIPAGHKNKPLPYRKGYLSIVTDKNGLLKEADGNWKLLADIARLDANTLNALEDLASKNGLLKEADGNWELVADIARLDANTLNALEDLARQWTATLAQTGDHHDLNNIAGPHVVTKVLAGNGQASTDPHPKKRAFLTRLEWSWLLKHDKQHKGQSKQQGESSEQTGSEQELDTGAIDDKLSVGWDSEQKLDIVAIDDQLSAGWDEVLIALTGTSRKGKIEKDKISELGSGANARLYGSDTPSVLLEKLGITGDGVTIQKHLYERRDFDSLVGAGTRPWMLVLDIRLFLGKKTDERNWYRKLAKAALTLNSPKNLAWPGFDKHDLDVIVSDANLNDEQLDTALSLLPRMCALRWPSVPIIVFSSTGRRRLVAKLADYGNIFLANQKPNVLNANCAENVASFVEGWKRELRYASSMLEVQKRLRRLTSYNGAANYIRRKFDKHIHLTIAFDETGDFYLFKSSSVGGVILYTEGDNEKEAIKSSFEFQEDLRKAGINFYDKHPYYTDAEQAGVQITTTPLDKKANIGSKLKEVLEQWEGKNQRVILSAFRCVIPRDHRSKEADYLDGAYLRGLSYCVELIFAELLPSIGLDDDVTYSAWFANKQTDYVNTFVDYVKMEDIYFENLRNLDKKAAQAASKAYQDGCKQDHEIDAIALAVHEARRLDFRPTMAGHSMVETIGGWGKAYSLMLEALRQRSCREKWLEAAKSLKARKLPYYKNEKGKPAPHLPEFDVEGLSGADYSVIAHLADAALDPKEFPNSSTIGVDTLDPSYSFSVTENVKLGDFLHVCKLIDKKRGKDGFKLAYECGFFCDGLNEGEFAKAPLQNRLIVKLKEHSKRVSGNELVDLSGLRYRGVEPVSSNRSNKESGQGERHGGKKVATQSGYGDKSERRSGKPEHGGASTNPKKFAENSRHHSRTNAGGGQYTVTLMIKPGHEALLDNINGVIGQFVGEDIGAKLGQPIFGEGKNGKPKVNFKLSDKQDAETVVKELNKNKNISDAFWSQVFLTNP